MSTWVAPITWSNGAVTAAQMNAEIRDHCTFLKGALDLITNSTTADTGTSTYLSITRGSAGVAILLGKVTGDSNERFSVGADGALYWGPGNDVTDTTLYRDSSAGILATTGYIRIRPANATTTRALTILVAGESYNRGEFGMSVAGEAQVLMGDGSATPDVRLYRGAADTWKTDDGIYAVGGIVTKIKAGTPTDADLVTGMQQNGAIIVDTSANKIWVRTAAATWKYVSLT